VNREDPLHTLAEADAADGEIRIDTSAFSADHDPRILLDTFFVTLDHACVDTDGIAHVERDDLGFELLFFDGINDAHDWKCGRNLESSDKVVWKNAPLRHSWQEVIKQL
jgi:hypothetical protein